MVRMRETCEHTVRQALIDNILTTVQKTGERATYNPDLINQTLDSIPITAIPCLTEYVNLASTWCFLGL